MVEIRFFNIRDFVDLSYQLIFVPSLEKFPLTNEYMERLIKARLAQSVER